MVAALFSTPAVILGKYLTNLLNPLIMQIVIIVFLSLVTIVLIYAEYGLKNKQPKEIIYKKVWYIQHVSFTSEEKINLIKISGISFGAGLITSLTGMGGGPIIMPALLLICYLPMKKAAPISHSIIMISSLVSLLMNYQIFANTKISLNYLLPLSIAELIATSCAFFAKQYIKKDIYIKWLLIVLIWLSIVKMIVDII